MDIVLINPPKRDQVWAGVPDIFNKQDSYIFPPLGIMSLASYLKQFSSHRVEVIDCLPHDIDAAEVVSEIAKLRPKIIGIIASTHNLLNVRRIVTAIKAFDGALPIIMGGAHVTAFPEAALALPEIDLAVQGDGEYPLKAILDAFENHTSIEDIPGVVWRKNGVVVNPLGKQEENLDVFPFPDRESCPLVGYYTPGMVAKRATTIISSRGCPNRCVFCNVPQRYRTRSVEHIVNEIEECSKRYQIEEIHFIDDIFNVTPERVIAIADEIIRRNLKIYWGFKAGCSTTTEDMLRRGKEAGLVRMHYGVETYSDEGLKALNKKTSIAQIEKVFRWTKQLDIKAIAYMIIGSPHEKTFNEVVKVKEFIAKLDPDFVVYSLFTPYPDAPIFKTGVELGLWPADCWHNFMIDPQNDYTLPTAWTQYLDKGTLLKAFKIVNRSFYFHPKILTRTLLAISTLEELKRIVRGGLSLIKMEFLAADQRRI